MHKELILIADPMCSWCWGFSPTFERILDAYANQIVATLVVGGLRHQTQPLNDEMKQYVLGHWRHVHQTTGQPFNFNFELPPTFAYNTEPACRAALTVRELRPENTFAYLKQLHHAFYVDNADLTQTSVLAELAVTHGVERGTFEAFFESQQASEKTQADFHFAKRLGIQGFPSVVLNDHTGYKLLTGGYRPFDDLNPYLAAWVNEQENAD